MTGREVLDLLVRVAGPSPDRVAVAEYTATGRSVTTWAELYRAVCGLAARAGELGAGTGPVLLVVDGTAAGIAVLLGLLASSRDVLCVERGSSHLNDRRSAVWRAGPVAVVRPTDYQPLLEPSSVPPASTVPAGIGGQRCPSVLQLTSGSTGEPRVVRHDLSSVLTGARLYRRLHGYRPTDRIVLPLPVAHSFGLVGGLFGALVAGAELRTTPVFGPRALLAGLAGGTVLLGTPLLYGTLVRSMTAAPAELRVLLSSGGPLPADLAAEVERRVGQPVRQVYGSTETGLIATRTGADRRWTPGSVGMFAPEVRWALATTRRGDGAGRLLVRTATMFTGYGCEPERDGELYYDTGDLATVTADGELFVHGRKHTFINVGGRKVNPRQVERILREHPAVGDVHVFARAAYHDETVHAAVVPAGTARAHPYDITEFCRARLAPHEVPRWVHILVSLPRTSLGKIDLPALLAATIEPEPGAVS